MSSDRAELFQRALSRCVLVRAKFPEIRALESATDQIQYLLDLEEGRSNDRSRLPNISLGLLTVRELWDLDDELTALLHQVAGLVPYIQSE